MKCSACGKELVPVYPKDNREEEYQFDNALWLTLEGGYGMFMDEFDNSPQRAVLCHECAHEFCEKNKWTRQFIESYYSHSHHSDYREANPEHEGWDYDE